MTTEPTEGKDLFDDPGSAKLMVSIMGKMNSDAQWTANQLEAIKDAQIKELQQDYVMLYHALEKVAARTDSATAYDALNRFGWKYTEAAKAVGVTKDAYPEDTFGFVDGVA